MRTMRTIATHILIAFALAGVIVGPLAMAADCPRVSVPAVTCANDHKLLQSQQRDTTIVFPNATKVLTADGTVTVSTTDIGSTGTGTGIVPVTGTDGKINVAVVPDLSGTYAPIGSITGLTGYIPVWLTNSTLGPSSLLESGATLSRQYLGNQYVALETYSSTSFQYPQFRFRHSHSGTLGGMSATGNGEILGLMLFQGVNSSNGWGGGAGIEVDQSGTSGATFVPSKMTLYTYSSSGANSNQLVLNPDNSVSMSGAVSASNITATPTASAIVQAKTDHRVDVGWLPVGTTAGTVAAGDDSRITGAVAGSGTITGTTNYMPKKTAGGWGDSQVYAGGSGIGVDTPSPQASIHIGGLGSKVMLIESSGELSGLSETSRIQFGLNNNPFYTNDAVRIEARTAGGANTALDFKTYHSGMYTGMHTDMSLGSSVLSIGGGLEVGTTGAYGGSLKLNGATSGTVTRGVAATTASYSLLDPSTAPGAGQTIVYPSGGGQGTWADIAADPSASLTTGVVPKKGASTLVDSTITDNATSGPAMPSVGMTGGLGTTQTTLLPGFAATGLGQTSRNWAAMTTLGTNVYAAVGPGDIYMQTGGTGNFVALGQTSRGWTAMTTLGNNVYATVANGDIYMQTNGTGNFVALGQTSRVWRGMAAFGNNVYASASGTGPDIYMQTGGTGNFVALSQATGGWGVMTASPSGVYATNMTTGSIYVQANGTGAFNILAGTSGSWAAMAAIGNDVYAEIAGSTGGIYIQRGGVGGFVPAMITTNRAWAAMTSSAGKLYGAVQPGDIYTFSASSMDFRLPSDNGVAGQVLSTDGTSGVKKWVSVNTSTATGTSTFTASNAHGVDVQNGLVYATHALVSTDITTPLGYTPLAPNGLSNTCTKPTFVNGQATGCASVTSNEIGAVSIAEVRTKYAYKADLINNYSVSAGSGFTAIISVANIDLSLGDIFITASVSGVGSVSGNDCVLMLYVGGGHAGVSGGYAQMRVPGTNGPISGGITAYYLSTPATYTVSLVMASATSGSCAINAGTGSYQSATMVIYQRSNG